MDDRLTILCGDALEKLRGLPDESVQCCVTSPPYWGLRDYGCAGQLGLETSAQDYSSRLTEIFDEVRRVLKRDGTCWVNLGDSYVSDAKNRSVEQATARGRLLGSYKSQIATLRQPKKAGTGLKSKDLVGIPWMVAFALRAAGWYLRSDIIWHKPNPMPESVSDRPTKSHEYLFLLTRSERYFYNADAIKEEAGNWHSSVPGRENGPGQDRRSNLERASVKRGGFNGKTNAMVGRESFRAVTENRNKRSVWTVPTAPFAEAHFATYPPDLIRPCILAGSRPGDVILDPFGGSGTTGMVALELGRNAILIELNAEYVSLIERRCSTTLGLAF